MWPYMPIPLNEFPKHGLPQKDPFKQVSRLPFKLAIPPPAVPPRVIRVLLEHMATMPLLNAIAI